MYDVVIVGSGPAGLSTAFFLNGSGIKVALIERLNEVKFNKYHSMCGHGISKKSLSKIRPIRSHILNEVDKAVLRWPEDITVPIKIKGCIIDRVKMLHDIRESIDAEFIEGTVVNIERDDAEYVVKMKDGSELRSKFIVGADGANSIVRKSIFHTEPEKMILVDQYFTGETQNNSLLFEINDSYKGTYKWTFPHGDGTNIGFAHGMEDVLSEISKGGRYIPIGGVPNIAKENALLVGDAAGMPNPVSFGGLKAAFLSGKKAAEAIMKNDLKRYSKWWGRSIMSSKRFIAVHNKLGEWSDEEMVKAVEPFRKGYNILTISKAIITRPRYVPMYIGCLFAFKFSW